MTDSSLHIGTRIKSLRLMQKRTIQDIADNCGLSKSMVSKIETNTVVPSVTTLIKIAKALGTNVSVLMEDNISHSSVIVTAKKAAESITKTDKGYHIFPFAAEYKNKLMQPFLFVANKNEVKEHRLTHEGEEFIYLLEGEMKIQVGDIEYTMKQGDSIYFNAMEKHGIMPVGDQVKYINVFV